MKAVRNYSFLRARQLRDSSGGRQPYCSFYRERAPCLPTLEKKDLKVDREHMRTQIFALRLRHFYRIELFNAHEFYAKCAVLNRFVESLNRICAVINVDFESTEFQSVQF